MPAGPDFIATDAGSAGCAAANGLALRGVGRWGADALVIPKVTSANSKAPSMTIGRRAGAMNTEDAA